MLWLQIKAPSLSEQDGQAWTAEKVSSLYTVLLILRYAYIHATQAVDG